MIVLNAFLSEVLSYESKLLSYESTFEGTCTFESTNRIIILIRTKVILFLHYTYTTRVHVQRYCISVVRKYLRRYLSSIVYLSSYFRKYESTKVLSKVRKYFRTRVRKYGSTFVRKYEDRYFRTFESTSGSTSGSTRTRTRTCTVLPEVRVHLQPPVRHSPSTFNILSFDRKRSVLRVASSPRPPGDAFAAHESRRAGRVRTSGVGAAARAGARSRARDGARARARKPY